MQPNESRQQRRAREREAATRKATQDRKLSPIVGGLIDGKRFDQWPPWKGNGVPTRENCDPDNPRQRFLWMYTAPPGMQGAPLMLPTEWWELMSWRQCTLGAGIVAEPTLKWQAPIAQAASPWTAAGKWVSLDTAEPERKTLAEMVRELPQAERAAVKAAVLDEFGFDDGDRPGPPPMQYTVKTLATRLRRDTEEVLTMLANFGLPNMHADSRVGLEVANRICAQMGL